MSNVVQFQSTEDVLWDKLSNEQYELIKQAFGEEAAAHANYGWGSSQDKDRLVVETNVYTNSWPHVLISEADFASGSITHHPFKQLGVEVEYVPQLQGFKLTIGSGTSVILKAKGA